MSANKTSSGIGFTSLLLVAFIVLKLCNVITWSWWWVLSPAWIPAGFVIIVLAACGLYYLLKDKEEKTETVYKSKWEERLEEMKAKQKTKAN